MLMNTSSNNAVKSNGINVMRQIILPACILFTVVVFIFFAAALITETPVTDKEWEFHETYNGESESENSTTQTFSDPQNNALSFELLLGILLFAVSVKALSLLKLLGYGSLITLLMHFVGSAVAFFVFVLLFGGYITDAGFGPAMACVVVFAIFYWIGIGLKSVFVRLTSLYPESFGRWVKRFVPVIFGVFVIILFSVTAIALIGGEYFDIKVTTKINSDSYWADDRVQITEYVTIVNPLTPTVNNYLRYLGTAAVLVLGIALLFTKANAVLKVFMNFAVTTVGIILIWPLQLDYFKLPALSNNLITAATVYASLYLAVLVITAVTVFIRKRRNEDTEEYESQFSVAKKKKNEGK